MAEIQRLRNVDLGPRDGAQTKTQVVADDLEVSLVNRPIDAG